MGLTTPSSVSHDLVVEEEAEEAEEEEEEAEMLLACVGVGVGARAHTIQVVCRLLACLPVWVLVSAAAAGYIKAGQPMDSRDVRLVLVLSPAAVMAVAAMATAQRSPLTHRSVGQSLRSSCVFLRHVLITCGLAPSR
ncbi:unnamed protein product [Hydatigera taeniaeformis]|uniref:Uncharacterized protein n=1 Tax=Hydatigena taeniaeformis TaxID=6205 RepID=A0A0R3X6E8_HYDTA|nr:unnamed protein product [Hydatigera taeniaeformis]